VERDVLNFLGIYWEPNNRKLAVHTNSKRDEGKTLTVDAKRQGIDIYELNQNKQTGSFDIKLIGMHPGERVEKFSWSSVGDIFVVCEKETMKNVWGFYMIT
jgi:hypothetical protein